MSGAERDPVRALRELLEFYRDLALRDVRRPAPIRAAPRPSRPAPAGTTPANPAKPETPEAPPRTRPARPPAAPATQEGLFSERFVLPAGVSAGEALETLRTEEIGDCTRCKLSDGRTHIVFGSGNPEADLMFVGEGPGADEDAQGLPFVGRAGQKLTEMIEKGMGIPRADVYIANIIKCRPPRNRDPEPDEIAACQGFLFRQIDIIRPQVIVALGRIAAHILLDTKAPISSIRGRFFRYRDTLLMPTFHPAYLLRQYTPQNRRIVWEDLKKAQAALESGADGV